MERAYILKDGSIVRSDEWQNIVISVTQGFLLQFDKNGVTYMHINKNDFRTEIESYLYPQGYYPKDDFLEYLKTGDNDLISHEQWYEVKYTFLPAEDGDEILTELIKNGSKENDYQVSKQKYTFTYNASSEYVRYSFNTSLPSIVIIPEDATIEELLITQEAVSASFYSLNKTLNISTNPNLTDIEKIEASRLLALSALVIRNFIKNIFPLFPSTREIDRALIEEQKSFWRDVTDVFENDPTLAEFSQFFESIFSLYKSAVRNSYKIKQFTSQDDKLFWLMSTMSAKALKSLTPQIRKTVLINLIDAGLGNYLDDDEEEKFIIRIISSFAFEDQADEAEDLLIWLVKNNKRDGSNLKTYYEILYDFMSTDLNIVVGIKGITNWIFGTNFLPFDTKGSYVQILYYLWQRSSLNPYDIDGNLKANSIGFKSLNTDIVSFSQTEGTYQYTYSHVPGYTYISKEEAGVDSICDAQAYYREAEYAEEAAPIIMPYRSFKAIGIFFDNFNFEFAGEKIKAFEKDKIISCSRGFIQGDPVPEYRRSSFLYGTYDIFQPVTLINTDIDSKSPIITTTGNPSEVDGTTINSLIPTFVLHHIDKAGDRSDTETVVGFVVDGILTLSAVGNLAKMKHLRWFGGSTGLVSITGFRVLIGAVEFSSGVLSFLSNFVDCNADDQFCEDVKQLFMLVGIASGSVQAIDGIVTTALNRQARKILDQANSVDEATIRQYVRNKLDELNTDPSVSPEIIDETSDAIYKSGVLYSTPIHLVVEAIINSSKKFIQNNQPFLKSNGKYGKSGFDFYKYDPILDSAGEVIEFTKTTTKRFADVEIDEVLRYGKELELPDSWIEGIFTKAYRIKKPKNIADLRSEFEKANDFLKPVEDGGRGGRFYPFASIEQFDELINTIKIQYLEKYGLTDIVDDNLFLAGSAHTKEFPPDLDFVAYISLGKMRNLFSKTQSTLQEIMDKLSRKETINFATYTKGGESNTIILEGKEGRKLIKRLIKEVSKTFDQDKRIASWNIFHLEESTNTLTVLSDEYKRIEMLKKLGPNKGVLGVDFSFFTQKARGNGAGLPPETKINLNN